MLIIVGSRTISTFVATTKASLLDKGRFSREYTPTHLLIFGLSFQASNVISKRGLPYLSQAVQQGAGEIFRRHTCSVSHKRVQDSPRVLPSPVKFLEYLYQLSSLLARLRLLVATSGQSMV